MIENNHAYIDPEKCKNCGMCAKECPTKAINNMRAKRQLPKPKAAPKKEAAPETPVTPQTTPEGPRANA